MMAPPSSGTSSNTNWETFGSTFTSVVTDILFSQDVFSKEQLISDQVVEHQLWY